MIHFDWEYFARSPHSFNPAEDWTIGSSISAGFKAPTYHLNTSSGAAMDARFEPGHFWGADWDPQALKTYWRALSTPMRIMLVVSFILWAPVIFGMIAFWYLFWHLPAKMLRRRSAMERGRRSSPAQARGLTSQRRPSTPAPDVRLVITGLDIHSRPIIKRRRASSVT